MQFLKKIKFIIPKEFRLSLLFVFFGLLITVFLELLGIGLIFPVLTAIIVPEKLLSYELLSPLHGYITKLDTIDLMRNVSIIFLLIITIKVFLLFVINFLRSKIYFNMISIFRTTLFT